MDMSVTVSIAGFVVVLLVQVGSTAYLFGKFKSCLNGTIKRVDTLELDHKSCSKDVNDRITEHTEHYHTGKK